MHHQRACRKEPARGSPLGRYAGRPRLTPGLKFEIRPIVRTLARCPAARRLRTKATLPGLAVSTDATWQAEIDQPSQELGMRRMSDTPHLSDTAAQQPAGAGQRNGRKGLACPLAIISARSPMPCGHGQQRCHRAHRTGADRAVPVRHRAQSRFKSTCGYCARPGRPAYHRQAVRARKPWIEACRLRDQRRTETYERSGDPGSRHDARPQQHRRRTRDSSARRVAAGSRSR